MQSDEYMKDYVTALSDQYLSFKKPVTARYVRWKMWGSNCLSCEIYVYVQE